MIDEVIKESPVLLQRFETAYSTFTPTKTPEQPDYVAMIDEISHDSNKNKYKNEQNKRTEKRMEELGNTHETIAAKSAGGSHAGDWMNRPCNNKTVMSNKEYIHAVKNRLGLKLVEFEGATTCQNRKKDGTICGTHPDEHAQHAMTRRHRGGGHSAAQCNVRDGPL